MSWKSFTKQFLSSSDKVLFLLQLLLSPAPTLPAGVSFSITSSLTDRNSNLPIPHPRALYLQREKEPQLLFQHRAMLYTEMYVFVQKTTSTGLEKAAPALTTPGPVLHEQEFPPLIQY